MLARGANFNNLKELNLFKNNLGDDGVPTGLWQGTGWAIERDTDYRDSANVCFRTQNQLDRQKGRIGIQPAVAS